MNHISSVQCGVSGHYQVYKEIDGKIVLHSEHSNKLFPYVFDILKHNYAQTVRPTLQISNQIDLAIDADSDNFAPVYTVQFDTNVEKYFIERLATDELQDIVVTDTQVIGQESFIYKLPPSNIGNITGFGLTDGNSRISVAHIRDSTGLKSTIPHTENDITYIVYHIRFVYDKSVLDSHGLIPKTRCSSTNSRLARLITLSRYEPTHNQVSRFKFIDGSTSIKSSGIPSVSNVTPVGLNQSELHLQYTSNIIGAQFTDCILYCNQEDIDAGKVTLSLDNINPLWYTTVDVPIGKSVSVSIVYKLVIKLNEGNSYD